MTLSTSRTTANTPAEHVADHNTAHGLLNALNGTYERVFIPTAATGVALQGAIDLASAAGGGTVVCSAFTEYLTDLRAIPGSSFACAGIWMRSNVKLKMTKGSVIKLMNGATLPGGSTQGQIISTVSNISNIVLEDVELDANGANNPTLAIAHGFYLGYTQDAWVVRCVSKNLYGTLSGPPGETMHFNANYSRDVHYIDCLADGDDIADTATGFSANNSFGITYSGCVAHDMANGMGFTHWQSAGFRYANCHAYNCVGTGSAGFNSERSEDILYTACLSGGRSPNLGADPALPWFTNSQSVGNTRGFQVSGGTDVAYAGCHATYNTVSGFRAYSSTAISPTMICTTVTWTGGSLLNNGTPVEIDSAQVGVWASGVAGTGYGFTDHYASSPFLDYHATSNNDGLRTDITGYANHAYRWQVDGVNALEIAGGLQPQGGDSGRTDRAGDAAFVFNLRGESVGTKYISGAGRTTIADTDFAHQPADGAMAFIRNSTTGLIYNCVRYNGAWIVIPHVAPVDLTTAQTVAGVKTFSSAPLVPVGSFPEAALLVPPTKLGLRPTSVVGESIPRNSASTSNLASLSTGRQSFQLIYLPAGAVVSSITFSSWTTAAGTPTNQWFSLYSLALAQLAVTVDDTTTAWNAFTTKTLAIAAPYTVPTSGYYYVGIMVKATTVPTLAGSGNPGGYNALVPISHGLDTTNTGLTTPATAPNPAAALTASGAAGTLLAYCQ